MRSSTSAGSLSGEMLLGIVEHGGTNAVLAAGTLEHIYIDAALAAAPESLVVGEVGKCNRLIAQVACSWSSQRHRWSD